MRSEAEDFTAQTFLAAPEGLKGYRGHGSFAAWLFGIARRKCAAHHRRHTNPGAHPCQGDNSHPV